LIFVALDHLAADEILGFYSIYLTEMLPAQLPSQYPYGKWLPSKVFVLRLGRLETSLRYRCKRVGEFLIFDASDQ